MSPVGPRTKNDCTAEGKQQFTQLTDMVTGELWDRKIWSWVLQALADIKKVWATATTATDSWDPAALRRDQLSEQDTGLILQETEDQQCEEWKDNADCSHTYKGYWTQWMSLQVRESILERHCEPADGW
jgi:hypothetical protein